MYDSIIILGPTATGKTKISIELAKLLDTEIINADSMYVYCDLNIGTAKPTMTEMNGVKHHLISIVSPFDTFNVSQYRDLAKSVIENFSRHNLVPIIVGGTGFYIDSLINNYSYAETSSSTIRLQLEKELAENGKDYLYNKLKTLDSAAANKLHPNDVKRVVRALEIHMTSGKSFASITNTNEPILKNPLLIGLNVSRDVLYDRINYRVDQMFDEGLLEEVKSLHQLGLDPKKHQSMKGIGYKELIAYLNNEISLDEAKMLIKQHTRNYAKRQITWFKRNDKIIWLEPNENTATEIFNIFSK